MTVSRVVLSAIGSTVVFVAASAKPTGHAQSSGSRDLRHVMRRLR
jgi:hypothetical protein